MKTGHQVPEIFLSCSSLWEGDSSSPLRSRVKGSGRGQNEGNKRKNYANGHLQQKAEQHGPKICCCHCGEHPFKQWLQDLSTTITHSFFTPCKMKQSFPHTPGRNSAFNHKWSKSIFHFQAKQNEAKLFFILPEESGENTICWGTENKPDIPY